MPGPLISLADLKTYLGLTGTQDDSLLTSCASNASVVAERRTSRVFAVSSNTVMVYSPDGQASITIHDRPRTDAARVITMDGVTLTENEGYWLLPDRRNPDIATTLQLRYYDRSRWDWYRADPQWFDRNLDNPRVGISSTTPNAVRIEGVVGHPELPLDVREAVLTYAAWLYWRRKSGASGFVELPNGENLDLTNEPSTFLAFIRDWRIRTAAVLA